MPENDNVIPFPSPLDIPVPEREELLEIKKLYLAMSLDQFAEMTLMLIKKNTYPMQHGIASGYTRSRLHGEDKLKLDGMLRMFAVACEMSKR
jgi:hypothetical protein